MEGRRRCGVVKLDVVGEGVSRSEIGVEREGEIVKGDGESFVFVVAEKADVAIIVAVAEVFDSV